MQHLMKNRMNSRQLVFQAVLKLVDDELAILLFLDQAVGDLPLPRGDGAIMLDPPYREAAHDQIDHCKRQPCKVHRAAPEINGDAQHPAGQRGGDADTQAAESRRKEYRREIGGKEDIRAYQRETPSRRGRHGEAGYGKSDLEKRRGLRRSVPAPPKLVDPFHHDTHITSADRRIHNKACLEQGRRSAPANSRVVMADGKPGLRCSLWLALLQGGEDGTGSRWDGWMAKSLLSPARPAASVCVPPRF